MGGEWELVPERHGRISLCDNSSVGQGSNWEIAGFGRMNALNAQNISRQLRVNPVTWACRSLS